MRKRGKDVEDAAEAWLRAKDPTWKRPALDAQDLAVRRWSTERSAKRKRPEHVPGSCTKLPGGWLIPSEPRTVADVVVAATIFLHAGRNALPADLRMGLQRLQSRGVIDHLGEAQSGVDEGRWWRAVLGLKLRVEACTPARWRKTARQLAEEMAVTWIGFGPQGPPLPDFRLALQRFAGEHLQRLTPGRRGGGRGPGAKLSVDQAVAKVGRAVAEEEALARARFRVVQLLQKSPGLSRRDVSASGGNWRTNRRAVEQMLREGVLSDKPGEPEMDETPPRA